VNTIQAILEQSDDEIYADSLNFRIDDFWLDEKLEDLYPGNMYQGTVPTLSFNLQFEKERELVWKRILPKTGEKSICPLLMCPDDCDFSCTLLVAEIENMDGLIRWNKIGVDLTEDPALENVCSKVEWFNKMEPLEFEKINYLNMLEQFKIQYDADKLKWEDSIRNL